jgi:hypothetical protein
MELFWGTFEKSVEKVLETRTFNCKPREDIIGGVSIKRRLKGRSFMQYLFM